MSSARFVTFDDALPIFVKILVEELGEGALREGVFLRDVTGRLTFVVREDRWSEKFVAVDRKVANTLPRHVDGTSYAVTTPDRIFDPSLGDSEVGYIVKISVGNASYRVRLVDRQAVGVDWLRTPKKNLLQTPIVVFASIKGGVGRSTALCVAASHLAGRGKRVLAIDMDLEAPGLGTMLLDARTMPKYGLLDYAVERILGDVPREFILDSVAPSWLANGRGRIDVVPAIGARTAKSPENVLPKIARAYLPTVVGDSEISFSSVVADYIKEVSDGSRYDVILVDARAGLHETTASALLGLGAEIYLFGVNQTQTFTGFDFLLSHVSQIAKVSDEFWERIRFVQTKALAPLPDEDFYGSIRELLTKILIGGRESEPDLQALSSDFDVDWDDSKAEVAAVDVSAPQEVIEGLTVLSIQEDEYYRVFDPVSKPALLASAAYEKSYSEFIRDLEALLSGYWAEEGFHAS